MQIAKVFAENREAIFEALSDTINNTPIEKYPLKLRIKDAFDLAGINYTEIQGSFNAFLGLEGEDWHPSITLYEKYTQVINNNYTEAPIYLFPTYDLTNKKEYAIIYEENSSLDLIPSQYTSDDIDDEFVSRVAPFEFGIMAFDPYGGYNGGIPTGNTYQSLKIGDMKVKQHKEDWHSGRSEVHFKGYRIIGGLPTSTGDCGDFITASDDCYSYNGRRIKKIKRRKIGHTYNVDYNMHSYQTTTNNDIIFYVIFESDPWPAGRKVQDFNLPAGHKRNIEYRSWQDEYHHAEVSMNPNNAYNLPYARTYSVNVSGIEYNLD
ncbi:hypothetical protein ACFQ3R_07925 [Mesonia ostreae]|uniref:Uncharacterized protein n=1 Tax=Mesonia ostreae TaxID=861110 RepID=A0ABU2KFB8_9FLAO|nr:hypothetical protein [Mesonia ostreae]MDT0293402.1 hypothetical protein [Mesonia ostreae]